MIERDYVRYALDHYQAPFFSMDEFNEDLNKVIVIKKMLRRYTNNSTINERLLLNSIILILNQFGVEATNTILFYKVEREHHGILKTFLTYLNTFKYNNYVDDLVTLNQDIIDRLRDITCRSCLDC